jgi:hypothetical protein
LVLSIVAIVVFFSNLGSVFSTPQDASAEAPKPVIQEQQKPSPNKQEQQVVSAYEKLSTKKAELEPIYKNVAKKVFENFYLTGLFYFSDESYYRFYFKKVIFDDKGKFIGCDTYELQDILLEIEDVTFNPFFQQERILLLQYKNNVVVQKKLFRIVPDNLMSKICTNTTNRSKQILKKQND